MGRERKTCSAFVCLLIAAVSPIVVAFPASCTQRQPQSQTQTAGATHKGVGVVVAVNAEKGTVKINHEKIEGYMEAMTMSFHVKDPSLLNGIAPNDRVEFTITEGSSEDLITEIKKL